jgi:hypothetical protein
VQWKCGGVRKGGSVVIPFLRKFLPVQWNELDGAQHRVYRVHARLFSSRPNRDPPPPHPQTSVHAPPKVPGGGTYSLLPRGRGGGGVPIRTRGQTLWCTVTVRHTPKGEGGVRRGLCKRVRIYFVPLYKGYSQV